MNITAINSVSFKGEWRTKEITKRRAAFEEFEDRIHTYHPDANESKSDIAKAIAERKAKFSGRKQHTQRTLGGGGGEFFVVHHYKNIVNEKPDGKILSPEQMAKLKKEQITLITKLEQILKLMELKSKAEIDTKVSPRRLREIADELRRLFGIVK